MPTSSLLPPPYIHLRYLFSFAPVILGLALHPIHAHEAQTTTCSFITLQQSASCTDLGAPLAVHALTDSPPLTFSATTPTILALPHQIREETAGVKAV
ncbi:hypothetical protein CONPUDRAFT_159053 [Coniophora puteana RWD-64-598 SS2]|uniref:Uncharacterized protein n=1 Tax=Coniophora puteana (strain RWD-64-598) TaxID=741705 RepID=A0A5M3M8L4_CONPW|nr:uncharacterized protein CONPUDRAFT_159053 [Coniophora puteana RWD-64-598 SS2]EIW75602.1 hypothetical protein CONPUDRAFT_159053 [Coniophora puteana RWD-64-598 SS2]